VEYRLRDEGPEVKAFKRSREQDTVSVFFLFRRAVAGNLI
jgi:hypothetical protein